MKEDVGRKRRRIFEEEEDVIEVKYKPGRKKGSAKRRKMKGNILKKGR